MSNLSDQCPVCGLDHIYPSYNPQDELPFVSCRRCGSFRISRPLRVNWGSRMSEREKRLRLYLPAYLKQALEVPKLTTKNWEAFAEIHSETRVPEKAAKLLDLCAKRTKIAGESFDLKQELDYPMVDAASPKEMGFLIRHLSELGFLGNGGDGRPLVTVKGWEKLQSPAGGFPGRCFVAMSFDPSLNEAYEHGIEAAIMKDCGLPKPIRMDREQHNEKICDKIIADIRTCQFMVADFTKQRPGVYFEAGFAIGLGRRVIWMCRKGDFRRLHFDTRQYNHIKWSAPADLREQLSEKIRATILK
jgi:hypothetical protein